MNVVVKLNCAKITINNMDSSAEQQPPTKMNTCKIIWWGLFTLAIIMFAVGAIGTYIGYIRYRHFLTCDSEECETSRLAESILRSINSSVDPCDDFYEFACGNTDAHLGADFHRAYTLARSRWILIGSVEQINETDAEALRQLKIIYDSCVNFNQTKTELQKYRMETWNGENVEDSETLISKLRELGNSSVPGTALRRFGCIKLLGNELMPYATAHKYILEQVKLETIGDAKEMYNNIVSSFKNYVLSLDWMDQITKERMTEKIENIKIHLGYPEWLLDPVALDKCYEGLNFTNGINNGTLQDNVRTLKKWEWEHRNFYNRECLVDRIWSRVGIELAFQFRAYYQVPDLAIVIPAGSLQPPYFNNGLRALDYGSLGMTMGHELFHGFQLTDGAVWPLLYRSQNPHILPQSPLSSTQKKEFEKRSNCFKTQYNNYWLTDLGVESSIANITRKTLRTLQEDMADNVGLHLAYNAYKLYVGHGTEAESRLPRLEKYTPEQIFFLSFAYVNSLGDNKLCTTGRPSVQELGNDDVHSPFKYQVNGALSNSLDFAEAWQCHNSSRMNPKNKCTL